MESAYLNEESFDFDEIWYINADLELGDSHATKYDFFFKIKDGGGCHIKNIFGHNSAAAWPISVEFCVIFFQNFVMGHILAYHRTYFLFS